MRTSICNTKSFEFINEKDEDIEKFITVMKNKGYTVAERNYLANGIDCYILFQKNF